MESKKIKKIIDIVVIFACVFPLIFVLCACLGNHVTNVNDITVYTMLEQFSLSDYWSGIIKDIFVEYFKIDSFMGAICAILCSNTICIYLSYLVLEILLFLPKMFISWVRRF